MPVETPSIFTQIIQDHLRLKQQNSELEQDMPLRRYTSEDPFENHPLFKTEEQARIEDTMNGEETLPEDMGPLSWAGAADEVESAPDVEDSGLWARSRDFDWGD